MKTPLRLAVLVFVAASLTGCNGLDRLLGTEKKKDAGGGFHIVAACMDNNDTGYPTFPSFLPQSHIDLIKNVKTACRTRDCQIGGDTWLAVGADCGHGKGYVGDEYYVGRGY